MNVLQEKYKNHHIILASGSPRRHELLRGLDLDFKVQTKEVVELYPEDLKKGDITAYLTKLKADVFSELGDLDIVITADTIVWFKGKAVMKPKNKNEAIEMLQAMSGKKHRVFTSFCLKNSKKEVVVTDVTKVYFKKFSDAEISYYVKQYNPLDKAGAYGAQDWIGCMGIQKIVGSYFNVMGLPVHKLYKALMKF